MTRSLSIVALILLLNGCSYCEDDPKPDMPDLNLSHDRNWIQVAKPIISRINYNDGMGIYFPLNLVSGSTMPKFLSKKSLDSFLRYEVKDTVPHDESIDFTKYFAVAFEIDYSVHGEEFRTSYWLNASENKVAYFIEYIFHSCRYAYSSNYGHFPRGIAIKYFDRAFKDLDFQMDYKMYAY